MAIRMVRRPCSGVQVLYLRTKHGYPAVLSKILKERGMSMIMGKMFPYRNMVVAAIAASVALGVCAETMEGEPLKVLMIGNSFSISCMNHLPDVAKSLGEPLDIASLYIGGCSLDRHWNNIKAAETNAEFRPYRYDRNVCGKPVAKKEARNIPDALAEAKWDIVTVQQASHMSWMAESYSPYGDDLVEYVRRQAPQAKMVVQETWSYTPWDRRLKEWTLTPDEMYEKLHDAYAAFAAKHGLVVIPMGTAVQEWRKRLPVKYTENSFGGDVVGGRGKREDKRFKLTGKGAWVPDCDVFHLGDGGEYFQAIVWAAMLFKDADMERITYRPDCVSEREARLMREIAASLSLGAIAICQGGEPEACVPAHRFTAAPWRTGRFGETRSRILKERGEIKPGLMMPDDLHPIARGYEIWLDEMCPVVDGLLGRR